jgi:hypothetical protein
MSRSISSPSIRAAGIQASYVPKRAANHGLYVPREEVQRESLKPGQKALFERQLYSEEARGLAKTHLSVHRPEDTQYNTELGQTTKPTDYVSPGQKSFKPTRIIGENTEAVYRGSAHWRSEAHAMLNEDAISGSVYTRQYGPSYQASNPTCCLTSPLDPTTNHEGYGEYGSKPRDRMNVESDQLPLHRVGTFKGTVKGTSHVPGYGGFFPINTVNPLVRKIEQGTETRPIKKDLLTENHIMAIPRYAGYKPLDVKNEPSSVGITKLTENGQNYIKHGLATFA